MILKTGVPKTVEKTEYIVLIHMTSGSAKLEISMEGSPFVELPEAYWTESTVVEIPFPNCQLEATLTGDAILVMGEIRSGLR
jgi:hypothetical protein